MNLGFGYTGSTGYIISPNHNYNYSHGSCQWLIHAPDNQVSHNCMTFTSIIIVAVNQLQLRSIHVRASVCLSVCVSVYTTTKKNYGSINLKVKHIVVYGNSSEKFDTGHCLIKVKITERL